MRILLFGTVRNVSVGAVHNTVGWVLSSCARDTKKPAEKDKSKNPFLPFCSERCRTIDMGAWLDGKYIVKEGEPNPPGPEY